MARVLTLLSVVMLLPACAGYCIQDIDTGRKGYVIYEPAPHLLVSYSQAKDNSIAATTEVVWLPNRAKRYTVTSWSGFGKADFDFKFSNGWMLTGFTDKSDNTEVMKTIASFLPKPFLKGTEDKSGVTQPPRPALYRVEFNDCGAVCGLTEISYSRLDECRPDPRPIAPCCPR